MSPRTAIQIVRSDGRPDVIDNADLGVDVDGSIGLVFDVVDSDSFAASLLYNGDCPRLGVPARRPRQLAVLIRVTRNYGYDLQSRLSTQRLGEQSGDFDGPEVLILDIDQGARSFDRLRKRSRDASLTVGRERIRGAP